MVIDFHTHVFPSLDVFQKSWLEKMRAQKKTLLGSELYKKWEEGLDGRVELLINDMDEAGVDKSVILPTYPAVMYGEDQPKMSIWECNEYAAEAQKRFPSRIIAFARIDALRKDALELLDKAVNFWGMKGVKIHPTYPVTHELMQPVMSAINEMEIPVLIHMGVDPLPFLLENGNPIHLDTLTGRFSKIKVIAAHHARGFEDLMTSIITNRPGRIYSDLALWHYECHYSRWHFLLQMRHILDRIPDFVFMGSDWPWGKTMPITHKEWFDAVRSMEIPEAFIKVGLGIKNFSTEEKCKILGENARKFLGIK
jgi:uncharacterized protein